jgi:outer membrane lipoprotein SlyB
MKRTLTLCITAVALAATPLSHAIGKNEKGCLVGGAAGGLGGHLIGSGSTRNTVLGAAAGCAVGTVVAKNKAKRQDSARTNEGKRYTRNASRDSRNRRVQDYAR